jgi:hypothetical protein
LGGEKWCFFAGAPRAGKNSLGANETGVRKTPLFALSKTTITLKVQKNTVETVSSDCVWGVEGKQYKRYDAKINGVCRVVTVRSIFLRAGPAKFGVAGISTNNE